MKLFKTIVGLIDNFFIQSKCLKCNKYGYLLCKNCLDELPRPENDLPDHIFSLYEYRDPVVKKILTNAKYRKQFAGLKIFNKVMHDAVLDIVSEYSELNNFTRIVIIPVPISKKRFKQRGYNQAEIIARSITNLNKEYLLQINLIQKIKDRTPQASIHNRKDRLRSPIGTFEISKNKMDILNGAFCIIVDDIATTGGTINEVRRILLESGASEALGLTIAH